MTTYVALLRGINVGGRNRLPMDELRELLEDLGLGEVRTYIQSGNVVFEAEDADPSRLADRVRAAIGESHGFEPRVVVRGAAEVEHAVEANPFPEAESEPKTLHLYFLAAEPEDPDLDALEALAKESERYALQGDVVYLHAPDGVGRSKLAARAEGPLGVAATGRNWRTVTRILELAEELD